MRATWSPTHRRRRVSRPAGRPGPLVADQFDVGSKGSKKVTMVTFAVIFLMLLWVYRSISTVLLVLVMVLLEVASARGVVAVLAEANVIGLSVYSTNLLTLLSIAAGTDYAIFLLGRYHEARHAGEGREEAFYTSYIGTSPRGGAGLGADDRQRAVLLTFTRLPYFNSLGVPAAIEHHGGAAGIAVARTGHRHDGQRFDAVRPQARDAHSGLAAHRHRDRALAGVDSGGVDRDCADRPARPARLQDQL